MSPRSLVFITLLALCHLQVGGQVLTDALPLAAQEPGRGAASGVNSPADRGDEPQQPAALPDEPGQEVLPVAEPEPAPPDGIPVDWEAQSWNRVGETYTLTGDVVAHYKGYTLHADKVIYHHDTSLLQAEGHVQVLGGAEDVIINADRGEMQLSLHTARFYNVKGSMGVRSTGRSQVYSTTNPFLFSGRLLIQLGEGKYRMVDGTMTNCRLPRPDWVVIARSIDMADGKASTRNAFFKFFGVPLFYLPYLSHPTDDTGRSSGFLIPVFSTGSSVRGYTFGEQYYWVISRSMDMVAGTEYYSKRGWAPNGDFRYKGQGLDHLTMSWKALLDRGVELPSTKDPSKLVLTNQGGVDVTALGRKNLSEETRVAGNVEYLSNYVYRLVFSDNFAQAVSSEVKSDLSLTHASNGFIPSASLTRFQSFASSTSGNEVRLIHLPNLRYDMLDQPLGASGLYAGLGSSVGYLNRAEPDFHARNVGRLDIYPHLALPLSAGGWSAVPEFALRDTFYSVSQNADLEGKHDGIPTIRHELLNRPDIEASVDVRPPAVERDFTLSGGRTLRHVIEPEIDYRYVNGVGNKAHDVVLFDTTDIATDTNEVGYSLTQRLYLRSKAQQPCVADAGAADGLCPDAPREWASWRIAQKYFFDPKFGGALITGRRNVFDATLDLSGVAFLSSPRNLSPVTSRLRFEAVRNLRVQWDLDYDPKAGRVGANNLFAGYSWGRTTVGVGHAMLNAVNETGTAASLIKSQQVTPFLSIGKASGKGFNLAANSGYDFTHGVLQYGGAEAVYNWDCCGLTFGYRHYDLGTIRNENQYLYSFTLANFGSVPGINRTKSIFRDPSLPPAY
jgi:LPS-assembly protein